MKKRNSLKKCISLIIMAIMAISMAIKAPIMTEAATPAYKKICSDYEWQVLRITNKERAKKDLQPLSAFEKIQSAAGVRTNEIKTLFDHTRPNGTSCFTALDEKNISYYSAAENIAAGYATPAAVMTGWMKSPGHCANILTPELQHLGVGYTTGGNSWTQLFIGGCEINSIKVNSASTVKSYKKGSTVDSLNRYLIVKCDHGTSYVPIIASMCKGYKRNTLGNQKVTVKFQGLKTTFTLKVVK